MADKKVTALADLGDAIARFVHVVDDPWHTDKQKDNSGRCI